MKNGKQNKHFNLFKIESINNWFEKLGSAVVRARWLIVAAFIAIVIFSVIGLLNLKFELSIDSFFLKDDPLMVDKENFEKMFGKPGLIIALILSSIIFGAGHLYQGMRGLISISIIGFLYALVYFRKRSAQRAS